MLGPALSDICAPPPVVFRGGLCWWDWPHDAPLLTVVKPPHISHFHTPPSTSPSCQSRCRRHTELHLRVQLCAHLSRHQDWSWTGEKPRDLPENRGGNIGIWLQKRRSAWNCPRIRLKCWRRISTKSASIRTGRRSCWSPRSADCQRGRQRWGIPSYFTVLHVWSMLSEQIWAI